MTRFSFLLLGLSIVSLAGCPDSSGGPDSGPTIDSGPSVDSGPTIDSGPSIDSGPGEIDAGPVGIDAGPTDPDAGPPADAGPPPLPEPMNHRPEHGEMCDDMRATPEVMVGIFDGCESHEECTDGDNGRCLAGRAGNSCSYDLCFSDDDCTGPCICGTGDTAPNSCTGGGCQIDADCGPLSWCSPTYGGCGDFGGVVAYECHTPEDECNDDADCSDMPNGYCKFSAEAAHWICDNAQCAG